MKHEDITEMIGIVILIDKILGIETLCNEIGQHDGLPRWEVEMANR